jgi:hypothetical protein
MGAPSPPSPAPPPPLSIASPPPDAPAPPDEPSPPLLRLRCAVQRAIFTVQRNLEEVYEGRLTGDQVLWCDRGVPDGAGYWPHGVAHYFEQMQADWQAELARYDAVLFMESAAVGGLSIASDNATRSEDLATASALDAQLRQVWQVHPCFHHIPHETDFVAKLARARALAESLLSK